MIDLRRRALHIVCALAALFFALRIYMAFVEPSYSFVDDLTYVSSAIHVVLGEECAPVGGNVCNYEHPPLAKLLMSLGFEIFGRTQVIGPYPGVGINQLGGRIFQIMMASALAPITYLVVNRMSNNWKMGFLAGLFVLVDPLLFTLSLTAGLDVAMVFFATAALIPYVYGFRAGPLNSFVLSGLLFGLSLLSKETAVFIIGGTLTYVLLFGSGTTRKRVTASAEVLGVSLLVFMTGLELYDVLLTQFPSALSQLDLILTFQSSAGSGQITYLAGAGGCSLFKGLCPTDRSLVPHFLYSGLPLRIIQSSACTTCWSSTNPLDWLTYFPPVGFPTALVLAPNYPLVWACFAWSPLAIFKAVKRSVSDDVRPLLLAASILVWNIASNLAAFSILGRAVFEWYLLPAVPAFAIGGAYLLTRDGIPRIARVIMIGVVIAVGLALSPIVYHVLFPAPQYCSTC